MYGLASSSGHCSRLTPAYLCRHAAVLAEKAGKGIVQQSALLVSRTLIHEGDDVPSWPAWLSHSFGGVFPSLMQVGITCMKGKKKICANPISKKLALGCILWGFGLEPCGCLPVSKIYVVRLAGHRPREQRILGKRLATHTTRFGFDHVASPPLRLW